MGTDLLSADPVATAVIEECLRQHRTLAVAESCTGGEVAARLTAVPGASGCFWGGAVVYTAAAKCVLAGLDREWLEAAGVVSAETTEQLARAIRERAGADVGLAVTGWAGPDGDGPDPVGCVYLAVATAAGLQCQRQRYDGPRERVRAEAVGGLLALALQTVRAFSPTQP